MSGCDDSAAQRADIEAALKDLETQKHASQNGPGDLYLALKRMMVGDGNKRAQWNNDVRK